jgi:hypothetical protein
MTIYAWTIKVPGRKDVQHVTDLEELCAYLRVMDLPGAAPLEFITIDAEVSNHGIYIHGEGSMEEWSLTWTKVDGETEVID